ncbi:MAG: sugar phosphate isomerase/epimerase [Gaiellales bacterium]
MSAPRVGYQLYSARSACARDFAAVIRAVGALGYDGVELAGLHGHPAAAVRGWLDEAGLVACGVHTSVARLSDAAGEVVAEAAELGTDRIVLASAATPTDPASADAVAATIRELGAKVTAAGGRFAFHNHAVELAVHGVATTIDRLLDAPPLELELDLGWAWIAEVDPLALLRRAAPGVPLAHVKDFLRHDGDACCPVGEGVMDWGALLPAVAATQGVEWLIVEQDVSAGDELDEARRSLNGVRRLLGR